MQLYLAIQLTDDVFSCRTGTIWCITGHRAIHNHEWEKSRNFRYRSSEDFLSKGQKTVSNPSPLVLIGLMKNSPHLAGSLELASGNYLVSSVTCSCTRLSGKPMIFSAVAPKYDGVYRLMENSPYLAGSSELTGCKDACIYLR